MKLQGRYFNFHIKYFKGKKLIMQKMQMAFEDLTFPWF